MTREFARLGDVTLAPPLPAALSVLMVTGLAYLGWRLAARLRGGRPEALATAAGFIVSTAATAVVVHSLALAQLGSATVLRPLGWALAAVGAFALVRHGGRLLEAGRARLAELPSIPRWEKAVVLLTAVLLLGLGAAALGPPTDADSIHYHLAVPLDWLRHGGAYARPDWFHSRLVGLGEALNLLGLAAGTDGFGAALQLGGLLVAAVAIGALAPTDRDRRLAWLLVCGCPVAAFLIPNQKPQMLPGSATTVAILLATQRYDRFTRADMFLAFTSAAFAIACKTSFLLTAGFAVLAGLLAARESRRLAAALAIASTTIVVIWAPVLARNVVFFGDPLSPFFERLRPHPDPLLVRFAAYLHEAGGEHSLGNLLRLPLSILGTTRLGNLTIPLGLGALAFIPALRAPGPARPLLWSALVATVVCVVLGQIAPRFFLEPFFWAGAAFVLAPWGPAKKLVSGALMVQGAVSAGVALIGAAVLFPGALTPRLRDATLTRSAAGYPEEKWLDETLPTEAVILAPYDRFQLFQPRPFVVADPAVGDFDAPVGDELLRKLIESKGVNTIVDDGSPDTTAFRRLEKRCGHALTPPKWLPLATRNPFNRLRYESQVFALRDCW
jgi:hypothetical protein